MHFPPKITVLAGNAAALSHTAIDPRLSMPTAASFADPSFLKKLRCAAIAPAVTPSRGLKRARLFSKENDHGVVASVSMQKRTHPQFMRTNM